MIYRIICAWCGKHLGNKEFPGSKIMAFRSKTIVDKPITHGICECCKDKVLAEIEQLNEGGARCAKIS